MIQTNFSVGQVLWIFLAFLSGLASIIFFLRQNHRISLVFLFSAGLVLRLFSAGLDPFLNTWDEQFHALVAKNLLTDPFKPMLIRYPVLDYDFTNWQANHIWLHKQPWFLWQIAFFFKIFGINEWVLRLPTAIMMSLLVLVIYRIGKLISNEVVAWYGAFIYTFSFFFVHFVSGAVPTDHNDAAFIFYVSLSIWSYFEYIRSKKRRWLVFLGIFSGISILNKWLVGFLVYSGWIVAIFMDHSRRERLAEFRKMAMPLGLTFAIAVPWQVFISFAYPRESHYEYLFNHQHFFQAVEGHQQNFWYHFYLFGEQYGGLIILFVLLPGLAILIKSIRNEIFKTSLLTYVIVTYLFFTLAATKMPMFCPIVSPFIFLALGAFLQMVVEWIRKHLKGPFTNWIIAILLVYIAYDNLHVNQIDNSHSDKQLNWKMKRNATVMNDYITKKIPSADRVVFNYGRDNAIMLMFRYNNTVYGDYPDYEQYQALKSQGIKMATLCDENLPVFLKNDREVLKIWLRPAKD